MADDKLQLQRFELKYIVPEDVALAVRDFVRSYLEIDEFGASRPNLSYPVHSLYLDSESLSLYWHTINGNKNRYKLRVRYYDERPDSPIFFEIKRRMNDAILKQRGSVRREAAPALLAGQLPELRHLMSKDPKHLVALQRFCQLTAEQHARPRAHVAYLREAWISPHNNSVRVTMDREVRFESEATARLSTRMERPISVFGCHVVLELKFTGRFPNWFGELVRALNLRQCSAAKYADGVVQLGEDRVAGPGYLPPLEPEALHHAQERREFLAKSAGEPVALIIA